MTDTPAPSTTPDPTDSRVSSARRVGWPEVGIAALAAAVLYALGIALIWAVPEDAPAGLAGITQFAVSGLAPMGAVLVVLLVRHLAPGQLGIRRTAPRWLLIALACGAGVIVLNILVTIVVVSLTGPPSNLQADYREAATTGGVALAGALLAGAVLTPIGEEFLFRGVLATSLSRYGPWISVLASSAVFAIAHGINYILPVAFVVGVVAALLLRRTGSVWPGVVVHATNNAYSLIVPALIGAMSS